MAYLDKLFVYLKSKSGSDLHIVAGAPARIRRRGALEEIPGVPAFDDATLRKVLREITTEVQWADYDRRHDLDFAYGLEGTGRFRANYFTQENGVGAVFRIIPEKIIPLADLKGPKVLETLADMSSGLVLVTGPTGSGKSTTLASMIDRINSMQAKHIVTIEDPIEFVHPNKKSTISQREVGADTGSFGAALRAAIREDADVILVGEMRDAETIALAITAAEMGLLVFGTLHTNNAAKTIDRIIDAFPTDQQAQVRTMLSESLAGVVSQLLLPTADGKGRVAVHEILLRSSALPNIIRENNTPMISSLIQQGRKEGMQGMEDALLALVKEGRVKAEDALHKAPDRKRFEERLKRGPASAEDMDVDAAPAGRR